MKITKPTYVRIPRKNSGQRGKPPATVTDTPMKTGHPFAGATPYSLPAGVKKAKKKY